MFRNSLRRVTPALLSIPLVLGLAANEVQSSQSLPACPIVKEDLASGPRENLERIVDLGAEIISGNPFEEAHNIVYGAAVLTRIQTQFMDRPSHQFFTDEQREEFLKENGTVVFARDLHEIGFVGEDVLDHLKNDETVFCARRIYFAAIRNNVEMTSYDIVRYCQTDGSVSLLEHLAFIRNSEGNLIFTSGYDILRYDWSGASPEEAERLTERYNTAEEIIQILRYQRIGLTDTDFFPTLINTEKPNALIIYAASDYNGAFEAEDAIKFLRKIVGYYDVEMVVASTDDEAFALIGNHDLTILIGHGNDRRIRLGAHTQRYGQAGEEYSISVEDIELKKLNDLPPGSHVFYWSCSNAEGGEDNPGNFANTSIRYLEFGGRQGRVLIAATAPFSADEIKVFSWEPLLLYIISDGENNTYSNVPLLPLFLEKLFNTFF